MKMRKKKEADNNEEKDKRDQMEVLIQFPTWQIKLLAKSIQLSQTANTL